jgi:hypothetical protein
MLLQNFINDQVPGLVEIIYDHRKPPDQIKPEIKPELLIEPVTESKEVKLTSNSGPLTNVGTNVGTNVKNSFYIVRVGHTTKMGQQESELRLGQETQMDGQTTDKIPMQFVKPTNNKYKIDIPSNDTYLVPDTEQVILDRVIPITPSIRNKTGSVTYYIFENGRWQIKTGQYKDIPRDNSDVYIVEEEPLRVKEQPKNVNLNITNRLDTIINQISSKSIEKPPEPNVVIELSELDANAKQSISTIALKPQIMNLETLSKQTQDAINTVSIIPTETKEENIDISNIAADLNHTISDINVVTAPEEEVVNVPEKTGVDIVASDIESGIRSKIDDITVVPESETPDDQKDVDIDISDVTGQLTSTIQDVDVITEPKTLETEVSKPDDQKDVNIDISDVTRQLTTTIQDIDVITEPETLEPEVLKPDDQKDVNIDTFRLGDTVKQIINGLSIVIEPEKEITTTIVEPEKVSIPLLNIIQSATSSLPQIRIAEEKPSTVVIGYNDLINKARIAINNIKITVEPSIPVAEVVESDENSKYENEVAAVAFDDYYQTDMKNQIDEMHQKIVNDLTKLIDEKLKESNDKQNGNIETLKESLTTLKTDLENSINEKNKEQFTSIIDDLKRYIDSKIEPLEIKLDAISGDITDLNAKIDKPKDVEIRVAEHVIDTTQIDNLTNQIKALSEMVGKLLPKSEDKVVVDIRGLYENIKNVITKIRIVGEEIHEPTVLEKENQELKLMLSEITNKLNTLTDQQTRLTANIEELKNQPTMDNTEAIIKVIETAKNELESKITESESNLKNELAKQLEDVSKSLEILKNPIVTIDLFPLISIASKELQQIVFSSQPQVNMIEEDEKDDKEIIPIAPLPVVSNDDIIALQEEIGELKTQITESTQLTKELLEQIKALTAKVDALQSPKKVTTEIEIQTDQESERKPTINVSDMNKTLFNSVNNIKINVTSDQPQENTVNIYFSKLINSALIELAKVVSSQPSTQTFIQPSINIKDEASNLRNRMSLLKRRIEIETLKNKMKRLKEKIRVLQENMKKKPVQISFEELIAAAKNELFKNLSIVVLPPIPEIEAEEIKDTIEEIKGEIEKTKEPLPPINMLLGGNVNKQQEQIGFIMTDANTFDDLVIVNSTPKQYLITINTDDEGAVTEIPINATYSESSNDKAEFMKTVTKILREKYNDIESIYQSIYIHITCSDTKTHELKSIYLTL